MSEERLQQPEPMARESKAEPKRGRPLQTGVRTLIVLVATCGVTFWAARYLWESQHPAYRVALGLQAGNPPERMNAIRLLVHVGIRDTAVAIPPLIAALSDPEPEVRVGACEALRQLICGAVKPGPSADAVRAASTTLIGSPKDPKPDVRIAALKALDAIVSFTPSNGSIDLERVFVAASEMLEVQDAEVRVAALGALGAAASKVPHVPPATLRANLADESSDVRAAAIKALVCFQRDLDRWIPFIFEALEREEGAGIHYQLSYDLGQVRPPTLSAAALPALVKGLNSRSQKVRLCALSFIEALGRDAGPAIPNLIEIMSYPTDTATVGPRTAYPAASDLACACAAARALGRIAPDTPSAGEVIQALTEVVRTGHTDRRGAAAYALGEFGPKAVEAVPALIDFIQDKVATKFGDGSAVTALAKIASDTPLADEAVSCLSEALQAESEFTRQKAIDALVRFGPKAAVCIPRIRALANDRFFIIRSAATRALTVLEAAE
jgi:HEAT repeat protein